MRVITDLPKGLHILMHLLQIWACVKKLQHPIWQ